MADITTLLVKFIADRRANSQANSGSTDATTALAKMLPTIHDNQSQGLNQAVMQDGPIGYWRLGEVDSYAQAVRRDGVVAFWRLDGNANDSALVPHNGTVHGGVTYATGPLADGAQGGVFNGTDGEITSIVTEATLGLNDTVSVELWIKIAAAPLFDQRLISGYTSPTGALGLHIGTDRKIQAQTVGVANIVKSTTAIPADSQWHHVVWTKAVAVNKLFIDGVDVSGVVTDSTHTATSSQYHIGSQNAGAPFFIGSLADVGLYPVALSSTQVANHYALRTSALAELIPNTAAVESVAGRNGVIASGAMLGQASALADGNKAMGFNGLTGRVDIANTALDLTAGPLSVEAWVNLDTASSDAGIITAGTPYTAGYALTRHTDGNVYFYITTGSNYATSAVSSGAWHHLVGTWDGTTGTNSMKLYVDGTLVAQRTSNQTVMTGTAYRIGQGNTFFNGKIDEVAVYQVVLSPVQIAHHYALRHAPRKDLNTELFTYLSP